MPTRSLFGTIVVGVLAVTTVAAGPQRGNVRTFDAESPDAPPTGFKFASMRQETPGAWLIRRDESGGRLAHPGIENSRGFSMAIADGEPMGDVAVSVRLRLSGGRRVGGIISRYQDAGNYYMTLLDLEDGELRMYRVFEGNRNRIEFRDNLELDPESWLALKVVHRDNVVYALLGGVRVFEDSQAVNRAFPPGRSGLIATGDTDAWFDDLHVEPVRSGHTGHR